MGQDGSLGNFQGSMTQPARVLCIYKNLSGVELMGIQLKYCKLGVGWGDGSVSRHQSTVEE